MPQYCDGFSLEEFTRDDFAMQEEIDLFSLHQALQLIGVPAGGSTGQVLAKSSSADYDSEWIDIPTITDAQIDALFT